MVAGLMIMIFFLFINFQFTAPDPEGLRARLKEAETTIQDLKRRVKMNDIAIEGEKSSITFQNRKGQRVKGLWYADMKLLEMNMTVEYHENGVGKQMNLFLMGSNTVPPFVATLAHPTLEAASADVYHNDDMEKPTGAMFRYILEGHCNDNDGNVIDAGANLGYFASYAAALGCNVIAIEPQPRLLPIIRTSVRINGFDGRFQLLNNIISDDASQKLLIQYDESMCWGCSMVRPANPGDKDGNGRFVIPAIRLESVLKRNLRLLKVDVEGFEVVAIESAFPALRLYRVHNMLVEWTPRRWTHSVDRGTVLLEELADMGYTIRHYNLRNILPEEIAGDRRELGIAGTVWTIPREKLGAMNEYLMTNGYGEANLWITLDESKMEKFS
jgi:FkbM family methyltransferase